MHRLAAGFRFACLILLSAVTHAADAPGLPPQRMLNDKFHPWSPPETKEAWEQEAERIRRQILVSNGLWPLPEKTPLEPIIHGLADRGDYTVEKVFFRSRPGVYVTGSLYRPKQEPGAARRPGVLCPHGHWANGRFYDAGNKAAAEQMKAGYESYLSGAHSPLQARMVQLARMGCTVFFYDMVGIADNTALPHREGFNDVAAELWLQNKMGLQTWNSIRALDFLESLPDVDPKRIAVTGASGGGTQTFMLCAVDPRPAVAFPAVMVGTGMQGGCQCENASYLRHDINNVAIAALTAPRPLGMTGANDWTIDIETKGLPELKKVYSFYGKAENVEAKCFPTFPHNYNEVSREVMAPFLAKHLGLAGAPTEQTDFWPMTRDQLTVFDDEHPRPDDWLSADELRAEMKKESEALLASFDLTKPADLERYRQVVGAALDVMLGKRDDARSITSSAATSSDGITKFSVSAGGRPIPCIALEPTGKALDQTILWIDGHGTKALFDPGYKPTTLLAKLREAGYQIVAADVFFAGASPARDGASKFPVNAGFPGYTYCYNRPLLVERVRDIVMVHDYLVNNLSGQVQMLGTGGAGPWALLAQARLRKKGGHVVADLDQFSFNSVNAVDDPNLLPGALKYGGLMGLTVLAAPSAVTIFEPADDLKPLTTAYAAGGGSLTISTAAATDDLVVKAFADQRAWEARSTKP